MTAPDYQRLIIKLMTNPFLTESADKQINLQRKIAPAIYKGDSWILFQDRIYHFSRLTIVLWRWHIRIPLTAEIR